MSRIEQEKQTVEQMIRLYCRKKEGNETLCPQCREVLEYAHARLSRCPFGEKKGTCRLCTIHCYKPEMREQMRAFFGWSFISIVNLISAFATPRKFVNECSFATKRILCPDNTA